jgi:hypothetical protein
VVREAATRLAPRWLQEPTIIAAIIGLVGTILSILVTAWITVRQREPSKPVPAPRPAEVAVPGQVVEPSQSVRADTAKAKEALPTLDEILSVLERHHQRATYDAVADFLGRERQSLFNGYARSARTSWVVSKATGLPTGTKEVDYPLGLREHARIIRSAEELRSWLRGHPGER